MPKLFVSMPFGTRNAAPAHMIERLDFDMIYREFIRPAAAAEGWSPIRVDELPQSGSIEQQFLREIFEADLMIADVSVPNGNVYYEVGVRSGISSGGTILIACEGTVLPFDLAQQRVLFYTPSTDGLERARTQLAQAIRASREVDTGSANPVRLFLERLGLASSPSSDPTRFRRDLQSRIDRASTIDQLIAVWQWARPLKPLPVAGLLSLADGLAKRSEWLLSVEVLRRAASEDELDFEAHRQLGWHLSKLGPQHSEEAHAAFDKALELNPSDPETLGMKGGLFKRQLRYLDAAGCYSRGASISPTSLYMRVNEAAVAVLQGGASAASGVELYRKLLFDLQNSAALRSDPWAELVMAEAAFGVGELETSEYYYRAGIQAAAGGAFAIQSALDQLVLLGQSGFRPDAARPLIAFVERLISRRQDVTSSGSIGGSSYSRRAIIHLSDLHFGCGTDKQGKRVEMHRFVDGDYGERLSAHLTRELAEFRTQRPVLVISGDLTYGATKEEFVLARTFLDELCGGLGLMRDKQRVILAPGNHDVHWPSSSAEPGTRFDNYLSFLEAFYGEELFRTLYPRLKWTFRVQDKRDDPHDLIGLSVVDRIAYLSMNSCTYESEQHHYGFIGGRQLTAIESLMLSVPQDVLARVAVLHHHLHPFPEALDQRRDAAEVWLDLSTVRDAGLVERRLEKLKFDLVLHGHKHRAQLRETVVRDRNERLINANRLIVCGAGSSGVNGLELGGTPNHFEIVEVLGPRRPAVDFVRVEWRDLPLGADAEWLKSCHWTLQG